MTQAQKEISIFNMCAMRELHVTLLKNRKDT